jgi:phosphinothricin acetyltransferase
MRDIYNEAVRNTTATFDMDEKSLEDRLAWFHALDERHPVIVAEVDGDVAGFAALKPHSQRPGYRYTAAVAIYVAPEYRRQGIGRALLEELLRRGLEAGLHTALALICGENEASIRLHESLGFEQVGRTREVGVKFGRVLDVVFMQKMLAPLPEDLS